MKKPNYRPEFTAFITFGGVIGLTVGLGLAAFFPEGCQN